MSKPQQSTVLFDALGPRGRKRVAASSVGSLIVVAAIVGFAAYQLNAKGFFESERWVNPLDALVIENSWIPALVNTLQAAGMGCVGALVLGSFIGFGRISRFRVLRFLSGVYVQFFRAMPVVMLIWLPFTSLNHVGVNINSLWFVVVGLAVYNGAVLAEILRSGINALPAGQAAAGHAIGLRHGQVMRYVVFPQAFRNMLPAVLAQLVVLLKDTALGYIVVYTELLRTGRLVGTDYPLSYLQSLIIAAGIYFVIAYTLSKIVSMVEKRTRRKVPKAAKTVAPDLESAALGGGAAA
ncbi:MAG TPA: amino acid ABC transporter permease [Phytomonospora sp.]